MPWLGSQRSMGPMLRALVYDSSIGGLMLRGSGFQLVVAPSLVTPSYDLLYLKRAALLCLTSFTHGSGSTWIESGQTLLFYLDDVCEGSPDWHARLFNFH